MRAKLNGGHAGISDISLLSRQQVVAACHRQLERDSFPRLHMAALMLLTTGVGWLASSVLLARGWEEMWVRYPVALGIAYCAFLLFLWLWLHRRDLDAPDVLGDAVPSGHSCGGGSSSGFHGGGGQSGGGGASGSWDSPSVGGTDGGVGSALADSGVGEAIGAADELAVPLVVLVAAVALVLGLAFASVYVVYTAPALLAEITVDAALSYTLVRRLKHGQQRAWLGTAIARTWWAAAATALFVGAIGAILAIWAPDTTSLAAAIRYLLAGG